MKKLDVSRISRIFESNRFLQVISVIIAVIAWFLVTTLVNNDAISTVRGVEISTDLSGSAAGTNGLCVVSMSEDTVDVRVTGKSYQIGLLERDDFTATLDLSTVTEPGRYELNVLVTPQDTSRKNISNQDFEILQTQPEKVTVEFDRLVDTTLTLEAYTPNVTAAEGCFLEQAMVTPGEIVISGPDSVIDQIATARVVNETQTELSASQTMEGTLQLLDENGEEIDLSLLTVPEDNYRITVPVYKQIDVPLTFDYINVPDGIDVTELSYEMSAESISIGVPVDAASDVESISLGEIDFRRIDVGSVFTLDVSLLAGYINMDGIEEVTVSFPPDGMDYTRLSSDNIVLRNVPAQYDVELLTERLSNIKFVGQQAVIDSLSPSDVLITVDFADITLSAGEQRVPVQISLLDEKQAWAVGVDYSVLVRVSAKEE